MSKRIGVVTGGGDCPGLNAVIRAVAKASAKRGWECIGVLGGYEGLLEPRRTIPLDYQMLSGLLPRGGTILGTANRGVLSAKVGHAENRMLPKELFDAVKAGMDALGLFALVCIGGDGTLSVAQQMFEHGIPVVGVPKTIDNDLEGTLFTFGFDSAVTCATDALDRLHTTAESHNRVMVLEVMGRYAGWIALYAGVAGGADVILIPRSLSRINAFAQKSGSARASGKSSRSSSLRKASARKTASSLLPPRTPKSARRDWVASGLWFARRSRNGPAKNRVYVCSATFNVADRRRRLIERCARCSVRRRWNSLRPVTSGKWSLSPGRRSARSKSATPLANSKPCVPTAISFAPRVP